MARYADSLSVNEACAASGRVLLRVVGASMTPALWPGDVLVTHPRAAKDIAPGDIAVFSRDGRLIVHRVTGRVGATLMFRGDATAAPDAPVQPQNLVGVVDLVVRNSQIFTPSRTPWIGAHVIGALVRRSDVARRALQRAYPVEADNVALLGAIS